ncbi:hypothetical protein PC123_g8642 [Phytophthora cactorum]|nr:hypothetical protein PC123_g8642 [Phytophthora cactorum]
MGEGLNDCAENGSVHAEQAAPQPSPDSKTNKVANRFKWSNEMVAELLQLRLADNDVKRRFETAQTKTQTALTWQYFASVLSESLGVVINRAQVSQKYRKLIYIYHKEKREEGKTGNCARALREIDDQLWGICMMPFHARLESVEKYCWILISMAVKAITAEKSQVPVVQLYLVQTSQLQLAGKTGMEAIAASMSTRNSPRDLLESLIMTLQQQHEETRRFQALRLQLLQQLVARESA